MSWWQLTRLGCVQAAIGEAQRKIQETELTFRNESRKELAEVMGKLNALNQGAVALNDKVDKSQIKSPLRGRVQRLLANTVGGVVQPGKDIVEIVPLDDVLVLEAKVMPRDIAFIHPGQVATVKFTAYDYGTNGVIARIGNCIDEGVADQSLPMLDGLATAQMLYQLWLGASLLGKIQRSRAPLEQAMVVTLQVLSGGVRV